MTRLDPRPVLVLDFGAQYAQLIARRVREAGIYSEIVPGTMSARDLAELDPLALVLSGGPASIYEPGAPDFDPTILDMGVPVLGICYGFQLMARSLGGEVGKTGGREYGATLLFVTEADSVLLRGLPDQQTVWMSHGDAVTRAPDGVVVTAHSDGSPVAAFEDPKRRIAGVQFHPEVGHTRYGQEMLERFLFKVAGLEQNWTTVGFVEEQVAAIVDQVGGARAICGLSGGVDSAVAAALVQRAIGSQLTCVFVDHGLLREGEREQVVQDYVAATGVRLVVVDAAEQFLAALAGVSDPEKKRKIVGREFIRVFEAAERDLVAASGEGEAPIQFLVQGTLYPDVVESGGGAGAATIKSHHNVGGLPEDLAFTLIEPLRRLFKDEVRSIGESMGLPSDIVWRHPFPGPGLAIRIVGTVDPDRLRILRAADAIVRAEITQAGLDRAIWQFPVVLLADVRSVGVQGDGRSYGHPIVLRPVAGSDAMTADWARLPNDVLAKISGRITNEISEVNRVVLDLTSKPPATIEWE
ncbi:MAG: glutamine-hydrolyzing GMP synthase [Candidatus Nanopelagicales bacterium]|nr:glutamine-hydrolyzing GMP synthase [Candidatus Nanopelagicales bacterium]MDZ4248833.1 glutamine-hydrolyzing GMP synthase [Candidatus Nanopelagicales bacterium]MDZ7578367.1 glutamine-hydrolyzing GMP synthase [Candidatus Nanopelagicales bacterium]